MNTFTEDQILYIKAVAKTGKVNSAQAQKLQVIIREQINPSFNMCTSCNSDVAHNFKKVVTQMEAFIGCELSEVNEENIKEKVEKGFKSLEKSNKEKEEAKEKAATERKEALKIEREERAKKRKAEQTKIKKATNKRRKAREKVDEERKKTLEDRQKAIEEGKKEEQNNAELIKKAAEAGEKFEILTAEDFGKMSAKEIIKSVKDSTGIAILIDPKSKNKIIEEAVTIHNRVKEVIQAKK